MKSHIPLLVVGLAMASFARAATDWTKTERLPRAVEVQTAKDWALSVCIGKLAEQTKLAKDASRTAAALLERGSYSAVVYGKIASLVDKYIARPYGGSTGGTYNLLKCLDMYHGPELAAALKTGGKRAK